MGIFLNSVKFSDIRDGIVFAGADVGGGKCHVTANTLPLGASGAVYRPPHAGCADILPQDCVLRLLFTDDASVLFP